MTQLQKALVLAAAMIGIAVLAVAGIIPREIAEWAPMGLLAIFPAAWMGDRRACGNGC